MEEWSAIAQGLNLRAVDFVATMTELTAVTIADAYARFAGGPLAEVIVGGGGARNPILMQRLRYQLKEILHDEIPVRTHADLGIDDKAKEALAFALMGYRAIQGKPGNVPSCTGATAATVLGQIAPGRNYSKLIAALR
ncbi:MAG: anhydro-N-acetylmuramic acid kinase [Caldilineaceae bacterium]